MELEGRRFPGSISVSAKYNRNTRHVGLLGPFTKISTTCALDHEPTNVKSTVRLDVAPHWIGNQLEFETRQLHFSFTSEGRVGIILSI